MGIEWRGKVGLFGTDPTHCSPGSSDGRKHTFVFCAVRRHKEAGSLEAASGISSTQGRVASQGLWLVGPSQTSTSDFIGNVGVIFIS